MSAAPSSDERTSLAAPVLGSSSAIDSAIVNIAAAVTSMAAKQPHRPAVVFPHARSRDGKFAYTLYTFAQLDQESDRIARGLAANGIGRGVRAALMVTPSLEFFALTFALFKAGATPVMIDPGIGIKGLGQCLAEAAPEAFIGVPKAHVARILFGWAKKSIRTLITVGRPRLWGHSLDDIRAAGDARQDIPAMAPTRADEIAAILFTSGSTGPPKGAVYTHGVFAAQVEMIRELYEIRPGEIDLPTFPLFALFDPALGMTAIIPLMDASRPAQVDPRNIFAAIEDWGVTNMFGSPALLNTVGRAGDAKGVRLPTLRRVISAGAPVSPAILERFARMLPPDAEIHTPYGATESLPVASIGSQEILRDTQKETATGAGVCVGRPHPRMNVRVITISDEPIDEWSDSLLAPTGEVGEIAVQGPVVTASYFNRPESTKLAKISGPGGVIHRMGDLGYFDPSGRLWFVGRKSHRVASADRLRFSVPCEAIFERSPSVHRAALVGVRRNGVVEPVICIEKEKQAAPMDEATLTRELLDIASGFEHTKGIQTVLFHPSFPVDIRHNAKIFREKLAVWAAKKLGGEPA